MEIVDLDPGVENENVRAALEAAMDTLTDGNAEGLKAQKMVTGLWRVHSGMKISTVKVPRAAANLTALKIGWTVARVRPRRPEPVRYFRCHGFGHQSFKCTGPDLTGRRCGEARHLKKNCVESSRYVACDRLGQTYQPHRTDSANCLERRKSDVDVDDELITSA